MVKATERQIKTIANRSYCLRQLMVGLGYNTTHPGGNTMKRFKRVIGNEAYNEIASSKRYKLPKSRWSKVPMNKRK